MSTRAEQNDRPAEVSALQVRRQVWTLGLLLLLSWTSVLPAAAAIVREPYLQQVTPTSVTIVWRTDTNSGNDSRVQYGTVAGNFIETATGTAVIPPSNANVKDHIVTITNSPGTPLSPGTTYFYNVGTATNGVQREGSPDHFFRTAPPVGSATPFRAWIVGDTGIASGNQIAVRNAMQTQTPAPDIFLHMGDIAYETGTDGEFTTNHFAIYQDILRHTPSWPTLGNHEAVQSPSAGVGPYYEAHVLPTGSSGTEAYYSFDYANVHVVVLDSMSSGREVTDPMLTWLATDIGSTTQEWIIAYFHHPPYTKGSHDSDIFSDSGGRLTDMREQALGVLEAGGVDLVLGGHSHIYERSYLLDQAYGFGTAPNFATPNFSTLLANGRILDTGDGDPAGDGAYQKNTGGNPNEGTVYIVAGHGGRSIGQIGTHPVFASIDAQFGSVLVDVNGSTLTVRNLRASGFISDTFSMQKMSGGGNVAPTVSAGPAQTLTLPNQATLDGTVTDDGLPTPPGAVTTLWSVVSGPGTVTFGAATAVDTTASFSVAGAYVLRLTGDDGALNASDELTITVNPPPPSSNIMAAVLPSSRSVQVGTAATAFGVISNTGVASAIACSLFPLTTIPATFNYQTTDPLTNIVTGTPNTPVDIPAGGTQTFVFSFTPTAPILPTEVQLSFDCANTAQAVSTVGLNTLLLSASATPIPDIVALAATATNDGIIHLPGATGGLSSTGVFVVASLNVGVTGTIAVSADTGSVSLPVAITLCQTNTATGICLALPSSSVTTDIVANTTPSFGVFVEGLGPVPFDPVNNRLFIRFTEGGITRGATSVAVQTDP